MVDPDDLGATETYTRVLLPALEAAQLNAASAGSAYANRALAEQGIDAEPAGRFNPNSLSGRTSDGRSLPSLLNEPVVRVKQRIGEGMPARQAMNAGLARLTMMLQTEVADAGRVASGIEIAARPRVGYARMLNTPSCGRCAILAGKFFRWNQGFQRHPRCDCIHVPSQESIAGDLTTSPRAYFDSLTADEQNKHFGTANAEAIRDGADPGRVINASGRGRSNVYTTADGRKATLELTGRVRTRRTGGRGSFVRLVPEEIYRIAPSRQDALDLLRLHGYLT